MADEAADVEEGTSLTQSPLVTVTFQRNVHRKEKYLEAEPKALGVIIAGCLAIAAQNLHLPTLRACLGMEIVACGASIFNTILTLIKMEDMPFYCWHYYYDNTTIHYGETCHKVENVQSHFYAECVVVQIALLAISATLAAYCCKVANCCGPAHKMPVITVQAPPCPTVRR
ncbi:uncharacterized protein LOC123981073 isoform X2 [Micropterus dolomieu]|uniref:uncharacterized protein LOC123981073 isoform X2 n=1 Tax=Micropterus dolomieu TaxID=147949 RepID=UPI001E8D22E6|nr:uncharacterized protein LOC123981073 isoform X2 [Micropterus dolomieu]